MISWTQQNLLSFLHPSETIASKVGGKLQGYWVGCGKWVLSLLNLPYFFISGSLIHFTSS